MTIMTILIIAAILAVLASLGMGVASMAHNGPVGHHTSAEWMTARVVFQVIALGLILTAVWLR